MAKELTDISFVGLLPESIRHDPSIEAAALSLDGEIQSVNALLEVPALYSRIDALSSDVLDHLAWHLHVDFYDQDLSLEQKRDGIRQSIAWHKHKGTVWAVRQALIWSGFGDADILEHSHLVQSWQKAGGLFLDGTWVLGGMESLSTPGYDYHFMSEHWAEFAVRADVAGKELTADSQRAMQRMIEASKPVRSHLIGLQFYAEFAFVGGITLTDWSAALRAVYDQCNSAHVPHFETIGWGCHEIGGTYVGEFLDGAKTLNGHWPLDGRQPAGDVLNQGHWGTWSATLRTEMDVSTGGDRIDLFSLDGSVRLDSTRQLGVLPAPDTLWHSGHVRWTDPAIALNGLRALDNSWVLNGWFLLSGGRPLDGRWFINGDVLMEAI